MPTLTQDRAFSLDPPTLRRELRRMITANPVALVDLDPYADGEHDLLRDRSLAALAGTQQTDAYRRVGLHRALGDHISSDFAMGGPRNLPDIIDVNPVTAAPFLAAYAVVAEPFVSMTLPAMPTVVPGIQAAEKTDVAAGGKIGQRADASDLKTAAWAGDIAMQVVQRAPAHWLQVVWEEVGAAVFATADAAALADAAAWTGIGTSTDIVAAVGTAVGAQPSERPPLVVLSTAHVGELAKLRELLEAKIVRVVLSSGLPAAAPVALVVGGRAVIATRTNLEVRQANDVDKMGANIVWYVEYSLAVRAPAAVVAVTAGP